MFELNNTSEPIDIDNMSLVMIESEWVFNQIGNSEIHAFLRNSVNEGAKLVAMGKQTSIFFQVLDEAGVNLLARDDDGTIRNPADDNPPMVGFRLKEAITPIGNLYLYPSLFFCSSEDVDLQLQEIVNWIRG
jgi:hypothetical protein